MGTTIAGNQHIGTNYKKMQYVWAPGLGGDNLEVEQYAEDYIFVYQFNPLHDQRDDGVLAVEFYYYYRKPTTQAFWDYCYDPDYYYFVPFIACYNDDSRWGAVGKWQGLWSNDSQKISLVGRESGWIHVTLHVDEYIWGRFVDNNGVTQDNPLYIGIYSPIPVFCWDNSVSGSDPIVPYNIEWDFEEYEDEEIYDIMTGGYLEDCYWRRTQINDYPSFYITYRDVTPESFNYAVTEKAVMNVSSGVVRKSVYKKMLADVKAACGACGRKVLVKRNMAAATVTASDAHFWQMIFKRVFSDNQSVTSLADRKHHLKESVSSILNGTSTNQNGMLFFRGNETDVAVADSSSKKISYIRQLLPDPNVESEVLRKQVLFRSAESQSDFTARPFASRLFFRTVQTVMSLWDWIRGKIREANNVVTFFCPIHLEIEMECRI